MCRAIRTDDRQVTANRFNSPVGSRAADRLSKRAHARLVEDIERLAADAGISHAALARAAGISPSYLAEVLAGKAEPTLQTYGRLAIPLGADLVARLYSNTGPLIRDRHQARILEALLEVRHPRWEPFTEVGVRAPARGWIDLALHEPRERVMLASEIESELRRLEQQVRWSTEKAQSLPSWEGWPALGATPTISRLLVVRRTRATRDVARTFSAQLRVAFPAHPDDAIAALTGTQPWPGPALIWVALEKDRVRFLAGR